jgi:hypothetical protein
LVAKPGGSDDHLPEIEDHNSTVGAGIVALVALYSFLSFRQLTRDDFTPVQGTVKRTAEQQDHPGEPYLEIFVHESPLRFPVPIDMYKPPFKKAEFWRNVRPGSRIVLDVQSALLREPMLPPADHVPTVFVDGLRDESTVYYDVDERMRWHDSNHWMALIVGAAFVVVTIFLLLVRRSSYVR